MTNSLAVIRRRMDVLRAGLPRHMADIEDLADDRHYPDAGPLAMRAALYLTLLAVWLLTHNRHLHPMLRASRQRDPALWNECEWAWALLEAEYGPDVGIRPLQELRRAGR